MTRTARIERIEYTPGSGIATLVVVEGRTVKSLHADAGPLFRALNDAGIGSQAPGTEISYTMTDFGTLATLEVL